MEKIKVLWIAPYPLELVHNLGLNKPLHFAPWITSLADGIKENIHLTVISFSRIIDSDLSLEKNNIKFHFIKLPKPIKELFILFSGTLIKTRKFFKKFPIENFDIVHIHGTEHQYATPLINTNIPKVISIQGLIHKTFIYNKELNFNFFSWRFLKKFEKKEIKSINNFICRTHWDSSVIKELNANAKIYENWEIIREDFFNDAFNYESNNLVYIGGIITMKGIKETLLAFKKINEANDNITLTICGIGNDKKLDKLIAKYQMTGIRDKIIFKGKLNSIELVNLYKDSFCLIHPTYIDNSPNSVCEAQVAGLPVIASNVGGVASLIENKETGLLVDRYDFNEIANQVIMLKKNEDLYYNISKNSKAIARKRHDPETILKKTLEIYNNVIMN